MPSILQPEHEDRWLSEVPLSAGDLKEILSPFPAENMSMYPVSSLVNSPYADDECIIKPMNTLKLTEDTNA
jgi:putative SOS response-associated peptidase YedK